MGVETLREALARKRIFAAPMAIAKALDPCADAFIGSSSI
jgi:hypothetical protein